MRLAHVWIDRWECHSIAHQDTPRRSVVGCRLRRITFGTSVVEGTLGASMSQFKVHLKGAKMKLRKTAKETGSKGWVEDKNWRTSDDAVIRYYQARSPPCDPPPRSARTRQCSTCVPRRVSACHTPRPKRKLLRCTLA